MAAGASYDIDGYRSARHHHLGRRAASRSTRSRRSIGNLQFGPQEFKPINDDWKADHEEIELSKAEAKAKSLVDQLNDAVRNGGKVAADTGASLTTSRLVTLGFLSEAQEDRPYRSTRSTRCSTTAPARSASR